jgi:hypothetical protein
MKLVLLLLAIATLLSAQFIGIGGNGQPGYSNAPALVQQTNCKWSSGTSYSCTLGSSPSVSDVLVLTGGSWNPTSSSTGQFGSISSTGAAWSKKASVSAGEGDGTWVYNSLWCATLSGSPGTSVTVNLNGAAINTSGVIITEWRSLTCTSDATPVSQGLNTTTPNVVSGSAATITTTLPNDAVFVMYFLDEIGVGNSPLVSGPTNSFIGLTSPLSGDMQSAYFVASSTGSYGCGWTIMFSRPWSSLIVALEN